MLEALTMLFKLYWTKPAALFFWYCSLVLFWGWLKDLRFYRRNGWDFSKSSGFEMRTGLGSTTNIPNKMRVLASAPLGTFIFALGGLIFWFGKFK